MVDSSDIPGAVNPVVSYYLSTRTKQLDPMTLNELRTVCRVLDFDYGSGPQPFPQRNVWLRIFQDEDTGVWTVVQLVVFDNRREALIEIIDIKGSAIKTKRGENKTYKTLPAIINDLSRIFQYRENAKCYLKIEWSLIVLPQINTDAGE